MQSTNMSSSEIHTTTYEFFGDGSANHSRVHVPFSVVLINFKPGLQSTKKSLDLQITRDLPGGCQVIFFGMLDFLPIGNTL